jgi:hypothetical protein
MFVTKTNAVEGGTTLAACLYHQRNQLIHVTEGVRVTSLSTSPDTRQVRPRIVYFKSRWTENCGINSKSGVNFQAALIEREQKENA